MIIGVLQLYLFIPQANSLKFKRMVLKSLKDKIRHKFNVSVAEVSMLDKWQRQDVAVACINNNRKLVNSVLCKIVDLVDSQGAIELVDYTIDFF
jgi:hypothetical protein